MATFQHTLKAQSYIKDALDHREQGRDKEAELAMAAAQVYSNLAIASAILEHKGNRR